MIVALAERDPALFRRLDMAVVATLDVDDETLEIRFRNAFDGAVRTRGFVDYYEAPSWAAGVETALDAIANLIPGGHGELGCKLTEHAIARIEGAIENIDDSDGHCTFLLNQAQDIHLVACRAAMPDPIKLARDLYECEMGSEYDTFSNAATLYADVLGDDGLAECRRLAITAWEKLPSRAGGGRETEPEGGHPAP